MPRTCTNTASVHQKQPPPRTMVCVSLMGTPWEAATVAAAGRLCARLPWRPNASWGHQDFAGRTGAAAAPSVAAGPAGPGAGAAPAARLGLAAGAAVAGRALGAELPRRGHRGRAVRAATRA